MSWGAVGWSEGALHLHAASGAEGASKPPSSSHAIARPHAEPMINLGSHRDKTWPDGWTAVTEDGKRSAQVGGRWWWWRQEWWRQAGISRQVGNARRLGLLTASSCSLPVLPRAV